MKLKETEKRLLEAVSKVIEEEGFTKIGINRIAKQAQCDKVLIYRYFGGLDGLLVAWAKQYDFYSFAYSEFINQVEQATTSNLRNIIKAVLLKQLEYLKDNRLMQELYVWELSGNSSFREIQVEREKTVINCSWNWKKDWAITVISILLSSLPQLTISYCLLVNIICLTE